jgi:hypothetical protein
MRSSAARLAALGSLLAGCGAYQTVDLGRDVDAGGSIAPRGPDAIAGDDASVPFASAAITASPGTVCRGACTTLVASATGGVGTLLYSWGQNLGDGPGPKMVCPSATTTYSVVVASTQTEEQSTASATITVVSCDGGVPPPSTDAGASHVTTSMALCVSNPSFEGPTMIGMSGLPGSQPTAAPPDWQVCLGNPDVDPSVTLMPASDGHSYVGLAVGTGAFSSANEAVGTTLCAPLRAGAEYSFCIDLGVALRGLMAPPGVPVGPGSVPPVLEIWGGTSSCGQDALLWTSPPIANIDSWNRVCGSFVPSGALTNLTLLPAQGSTMVGAGTWSYVVVDHLGPGP